MVIIMDGNIDEAEEQWWRFGEKPADATTNLLSSAGGFELFK
jgi:hypothetical protein